MQGSNGDGGVIAGSNSGSNGESEMCAKWALWQDLGNEKGLKNKASVQFCRLAFIWEMARWVDGVMAGLRKGIMTAGR